MTFRRRGDDERDDDDFYDDYEEDAIDVDADLEDESDDEDEESGRGSGLRRPSVRPFGDSSSSNRPASRLPGSVGPADRTRSTSNLPGSRGSGYTPRSSTDRPSYGSQRSTPGSASDRDRPPFSSQRSTPASASDRDRPSYGSQRFSSSSSASDASSPPSSRPPYSTPNRSSSGRDDSEERNESGRPSTPFGRSSSTGTHRAVGSGASRESESNTSSSRGSSSSRDSSSTRSSNTSASGGGVGGRLSQGLGGLRSKLPGGGKGASSSPRASTTTSAPRRPGGFGRGQSSGGSSRSTNTSSASSDQGGIAGKLTQGLGGLRSKLPGGGKGASSTSSSRSSASPASTSPFGGGSTSSKRSTGSTSAARSTGGSRFGNRNASTPARSSTAAGQSSSGGLLSRIPLPFGKKDESASASRSRTTTREKMQRASKAPRIDESGLTLDNKLDILGVVLVFAALALFFSSMSATKGQLTEGVNTFFSQLLGQGAIAVPVVMFAAGIWLIIRHFGDEAPVLDPVRVMGIVLLYIGALLLFQFIDSFNPAYANINLANPSELQLQLELSYNKGLGGGWLGSQLYFALVTNITEAGMIVAMGGLLLIGTMLVLRISAAEVAIFFISLWRSFVDSRQRRAQARQVRARMAAAELAAAVDSRVNVSKPAVAELPGGANPALPAASSQPEEPRPIPITMGGKTVTAFVGDEAANTSAGSNGSGGNNPLRAAGRLLNAVPSLPGRGRSSGQSDQSAQPAASLPSTTPAAAQNTSSGRLGGLFNRRSNEAPATPAQPAAQQTAPAASAQASEPSPPRVGDLLRPATAQQAPLFSQASTETAAAPAASSAREDKVEAVNPATPKGSGPTPREESRNVWARPVARSTPETDAAESLSERRDRLNAIRSGQNNHPSAPPEDQTAYPADRRDASSAVQPVAAAGTPPPRRQPVINFDSESPDDGKTNGASSSPPATPVFSKPSTPPVRSQPVRSQRQWKLPDYKSLLNPGSESDFDREVLLKRARIIEETLQSFGAPGRVVEVNTGPVITQFGVEPDYLVARSGKKSRVKVGAIAQLDKDLQLALGAKSIRIEAPVPGKGYVGIEVPNEEASLVSLRDVMESEEFQKIKSKSALTLGLGQSVDGTPVSADLSAMPHLLIAGTTGSGKSVLVNAIICGLLINNRPDRVRFIMVDPKRVELTGYNGIPHLVAPVVVDLERTLGVLRWVTREMDERYKQFSDAGARNIEDFNKHLPAGREQMPYIVVIIDELADLMMLAPDETERVITRIAALARATGIHLVIATQRPSVDVVTGLIKANFPARVAFAVAGGVDSRVILDQPGAERLLGRGDMLYVSGSSPAPVRLQGVFVSPEEIDNVVNYWKRQNAENPEPHIIKSIALDDAAPEPTPAQQHEPLVTGQAAFWDNASESNGSVGLHDRVKDERDELYDQAVEMVQRLNKASVSLLQRRLRIGYTRAARLIDMMEEEGIVGPAQEGSKPREVLKEHKST